MVDARLHIIIELSKCFEGKAYNAAGRLFASFNEKNNNKLHETVIEQLSVQLKDWKTQGEYCLSFYGFPNTKEIRKRINDLKQTKTIQWSGMPWEIEDKLFGVDISYYQERDLMDILYDQLSLCDYKKYQYKVLQCGQVIIFTYNSIWTILLIWDWTSWIVSSFEIFILLIKVFWYL